MNKVFLMAAVMVAACASLAEDGSLDEKLRKVLYRATQYIDDPHGGPGEVRYAIRLAGNDTNLVVSLMKQLIAEGAEDVETDMFYISEIGKYGTSSDLPFLYQRVATSNLCEHATEAVLRIEGLNTNSMMQLVASLPDRRYYSRRVLCSWGRILQAARKLPDSSPIRVVAVSNAVQYAAQETEHPSSFDRSLTRTDPTYATSKRRLAVLRSVRNLGASEWETNFVAQAIRELEAYPEANLPE